MKVFVYGYSAKEEPYFMACCKELGVTIQKTSQYISKDTIALCKGYTCISVISTPLDEALVTGLYEQGVRFISTRTIGYDHIDLGACQRLGMHVANVSYSPESVADFTIMLMLMSLRKMRLIMKSGEVQDYSFHALEGRNLKGRVVGVVGTGSIGTTLVAHLQGFGCRILAYTHHPKKELEAMVTYVDLETLYRLSDVISLHIPLTQESTHMIDENAIAMMKKGVILVNTARGALIDNAALIHGIETGKVGGAALDVVEGETGIYYQANKGRVLTQHDMAILNSFPNVIMSAHMAFLTEESTKDMVVHSMQSCKEFLMHGDVAHKIV